MYYDKYCFCAICGKAKMRDGWDTCRTCHRVNPMTSTFKKLTKEKEQSRLPTKSPPRDGSE